MLNFRGRGWSNNNQESWQISAWCWWLVVSKEQKTYLNWGWRRRLRNNKCKASQWFTILPPFQPTHAVWVPPTDLVMQSETVWSFPVFRTPGAAFHGEKIPLCQAPPHLLKVTEAQKNNHAWIWVNITVMDINWILVAYVLQILPDLMMIPTTSAGHGPIRALKILWLRRNRLQQRLVRTWAKFWCYNYRNLSANTLASELSDQVWYKHTHIYIYKYIHIITYL